MSEDRTQNSLHPDPTMKKGALSVVVISTIGFTVMFAVWLMFGILAKPIRAEFSLTEVQYSWVVALAVLNGSMWRLPAGMLADRFGGRKVMTISILVTAIPSVLVAYVQSYAMLLVLAFLIGFAGNSFTTGIAWNAAWTPKEKQGFALGLFGAGNVGASATKFIAPPIIGATAGATYAFGAQGGWRLIPLIYAVMLVALALVTWFGTPKKDIIPNTGRTTREMLQPLKQIRVWRFSLYYVAVFGAYVALSAWLPTYYLDNFNVSLATAGLLTATFIFPASLLRPVGGWFSDKFGARKAMYGTLITMLVSSGILMMPNGHLVINQPDGGQTEHLAYSMTLVPFVILVFILGCAMGIGKAAVYKHIPEYFPKDVGAVGGLVGMLGGLGGFVLPPLFAYTKAWFGFPSSMFFVLFLLIAACLIWMHLTVVSMLHKEAPHLGDRLEAPSEAKSS